MYLIVSTFKCFCEILQWHFLMSIVEQNFKNSTTLLFFRVPFSISIHGDCNNNVSREPSRMRPAARLPCHPSTGRRHRRQKGLVPHSSETAGRHSLGDGRGLCRRRHRPRPGLPGRRWRHPVQDWPWSSRRRVVQTSQPEVGRQPCLLRRRRGCLRPGQVVSGPGDQLWRSVCHQRSSLARFPGCGTSRHTSPRR